MMNAREARVRWLGWRWHALALLFGGLVAAGPSAAQLTCDVEFRFDDPGPLALVAFSADYTAAAGDFVGDSTIPGFGPSWGSELLACSSLVASQEFTAIDDNAGGLTVFVAAQLGAPFVGPVPIATCIFAVDSGFPCPEAGDFAIGEAVFPDDPFPPPFPPPPAPAISLTVTPRTPVCGDGFREGTEACDDGNTSDGDCCAATCAFEPAGTPCPDANVCTSAETCDGAGSCVVGSTLQCDDGLPCTHDVCDPALGCRARAEPDPACHPMLKAKLGLIDRPDDSGDRLKVNAKMGGEIGAIGDPTAATAYTVCVFDAAGGATSSALQIDVPPGGPWAARGASGTFGYVDASRANDGVEKVRLAQDKKGIVKFLLIGKAANLPLPGPIGAGAYFAAAPAVTIQVESSDASCWRRDLHTVQNDASRYSGKR